MLQIFFLDSVSGLCVPFALGVWWIPESPVYLLLKDKIRETEIALRFFDREMADLPSVVRPENRLERRPKFFSAIRNPENFKPFFCGIILMGFFQVSSFL
jgi:hypothetical protein